MEKQIKEPDIIGGQGPLTKEEESAISKYLADKKAKGKRKLLQNPNTRKKELLPTILRGKPQRPPEVLPSD